MSYEIYTRKLILEMPNGTILPMVESKDSSLTTIDYDCRGRKYEHHIASWGILKFGEKGSAGILVEKEDYENDLEKSINHQIEEIKDFYNSCHYGEKKVIKNNPMDEDCYYGDHFPSGRSLKAMKSFFSIKHAIPIDNFFENWNRPLGISFSVFNTKDYRTIWRQKYEIEDFKGFEKLNNDVKSFRNKGEKDLDECFEINIYEFDDVKQARFKNEK